MMTAIVCLAPLKLVIQKTFNIDVVDFQESEESQELEKELEKDKVLVYAMDNLSPKSNSVLHARAQHLDFISPHYEIDAPPPDFRA